MIWIGLYAAIAFVVGAMLFVFGECRQAPGAAHRCSGACAVAAGILWPVVVVGAAQFGLIVALCNVIRGTAAPSTSGRADSGGRWVEARRSLLGAGEGVADTRLGQLGRA